MNKNRLHRFFCRWDLDGPIISITISWCKLTQEHVCGRPNLLHNKNMHIFYFPLTFLSF